MKKILTFGGLQKPLCFFLFKCCHIFRLQQQRTRRRIIQSEMSLCATDEVKRAQNRYCAMAFVWMIYLFMIPLSSYAIFFQLTWIDLCFSTYASILDGESKNVFDKFPTLQKLIETVHKLPAIEKWIKQRPETPFQIICYNTTISFTY